MNDFINMDTEVITIVRELRRLRVILDELNASKEREVSSRRACWDNEAGLKKALRDNPCKETAAAYFAVVDCINGMESYKRENDIDARRKVARDRMQELHKQMQELLGIGMTEKDWG